MFDEVYQSDDVHGAGPEREAEAGRLHETGVWKATTAESCGAAGERLGVEVDTVGAASAAPRGNDQPGVAAANIKEHSAVERKIALELV